MSEHLKKDESASIRKHKPVLMQEVLHYLDPQPHKTYLDVTFGTGGHTRAILEKEPTCNVIALDWDEKVLEKYGYPLQLQYGADRLQLLWTNFALLYKVSQKYNIEKVDGILADFGTSQIQIFEREGFSFSQDTPLDMRMNTSYHKKTAANILAEASEEELATIFFELGGERYGRQIAREIVSSRRKEPLLMTKQLASLVSRVVRSGYTKTHPATKVFQALRIYVNKELENISAFLPVALSLLAPHGKLVCISFHSLEDRIVKNFFREQKQAGVIDILTPKVVTATEEEMDENRSSRSACLRAVRLREK